MRVAYVSIILLGFVLLTRSPIEARSYRQAVDQGLSHGYLRRVIETPSPPIPDRIIVSTELGRSWGVLHVSDLNVRVAKQIAEEQNVSYSSLIISDPRFFSSKIMIPIELRRLRWLLKGKVDLPFPDWLTIDWVIGMLDKATAALKTKGSQASDEVMRDLDARLIDGVKGILERERQVSDFIRARYGHQGSRPFIISMHVAALTHFPELTRERDHLRDDLSHCGGPCFDFYPALSAPLDALVARFDGGDPKEIGKLGTALLEEMTGRLEASETLVPSETAMFWEKKGEEAFKDKRHDEAIAAYQKALRFPDDWSSGPGYLHLRIGKAHHEKSEFDAAASALEKAVELDPLRHEAQFELGRIQLRKRDMEKAISSLKKAVELKPNSGLYHALLGEAYYAAKDYDRAIQAFEAVNIHAFFKKHPEPFYKLGLCYVAKRDWDKALAHFEQAVQIDPKHANAHHELGRVFFEKKEYDQAIKAFEEAIRLNPKNAEAYLYLGDSHYAKKDYAKAVPPLTKAMELAPADSRPPHWLADAHYSLGNYDQAIPLYEKALRLHPRLSVWWHGASLAKKGRREEALAAYQRAIENDPKNSAAYKALGDLHAAMGNVREAIAAYEKFLELAPQDEAVPTVRKAIDALRKR